MSLSGAHPSAPAAPTGSTGVSRRTLISSGALAGAGLALSPLSAGAAPRAGCYTIRYDRAAARQTVLGLGVEIQSDSIGSGNDGLPDEVSGVPYDLTRPERARFYRQMIRVRRRRGFRYLRLALGLYYRGTDASGRHLRDRYPGQAALLADMIRRSGMEGIAAEYWSPTPGWKSNGSYIGGSLASFSPRYLDAVGDAMVGDLDYLRARGVPISMWGLQNEPLYSTPYSSCVYDADQYHDTFAAVAPKVRARYPDAMINVNSLDGWSGDLGAAVRDDPATLAYVDAWTYHRIGIDSDDQITGDYTSGARGKPVFNNEFEYLDNVTSDVRTINTAQSIMNWMTFQNAPTWFWLHALKPTTNAESPWASGVRRATPTSATSRTSPSATGTSTRRTGTPSPVSSGTCPGTPCGTWWRNPPSGATSGSWPGGPGPAGRSSRSRTGRRPSRSATRSTPAGPSRSTDGGSAPRPMTDRSAPPPARCSSARCRRWRSSSGSRRDQIRASRSRAWPEPNAASIGRSSSA